MNPNPKAGASASAEPSSPRTAPQSAFAGLLILLPLLAATAVSLGAIAPRVWLVLAFDGFFVIALLASAAGWGAWPLRWLLRGPRGGGQRVLLAIGLGLGIVSVFTLVLGVSGLLRAESAWGVIAIGVVLGAARLVPVRSKPVASAPGSDGERKPADDDATAGSSRLSRVLESLTLLVIAPPLAVAMLGASLPPGILWPGEARGYDALEYHLQGPREYFDAGRIAFLPHNVYASFPQQQEMLYLLLMYLSGSPRDGAIPAQLLHLATGVLFVCVVAAWAKPGWPRLMAVIATGSTPWLAYLGCLAYVELPILFFGALTAAVLAEQLVSSAAGPTETCADGNKPAARGNWRNWLAAGLLAGLAAGCKYTAVATVAAAVPVSALLPMRAAWRARVRGAAIMALGAAGAFSPWLIRNAAFTGNPAYPFAYECFGGVAWSGEQSQQWAAAHRLPADADSIAGRAGIAREELMFSVENGRFGAEQPLFGPAIFIAAFFGIAATRRTVFQLIWFAAILGIWTAFTHMPGRFAVPLIIPAALLAGQGGFRFARATVTVMRGIVFLAAILGALSISRRFVKDALPGVALNDLVGATAAWADAHPLNDEKVVPRDGFVWIVGDAAVFHVQRRMHYTTPFNRDPWLGFAESGADARACVDWLRARGVTHVAFHWAEIERLSRPGNYGFSPIATRAWVDGLAAAGLEQAAAFRTPSGAVFEEVYRVTP